MNRKKLVMPIAFGLIFVGLLIAGLSLASVGFDFSKLSTVSYEKKSYEVSGSFEKIDVTGTTEDIRFALSEDGTCRVVCHEQEDEPHHVEASGNTLIIENTGKNKWHFFDFSFLTERPSVTVWLPEKEYETLDVKADTGSVTIPADFSFGSVSIRLGTGDAACRASVAGRLSVRTGTGQIQLSGLTAETINLSTDTGGIRAADTACSGDMEINVSTGRTVLENITCGNLLSAGSTGRMTLTNVIASGAFTLRRSTGSILFEACDAKEITVTTDTGSVKGTLLTDKTFFVHSDTGRVDVPKTSSGGRCEITSDTGSIQIEVRNTP